MAAAGRRHRKVIGAARGVGMVGKMGLILRTTASLTWTARWVEMRRVQGNVIRYEKDGEMERQDELIGQYEEEEKAQREWVSGRNSTTRTVMQTRGSGSRSALKKLKDGTIIHDASYLVAMELDGPEAEFSGSTVKDFKRVRRFVEE